MKLLLITLAVACLAVPVMGQDDAPTWGYAGVEYESEVGVRSTFGVSQQLTGDLYLLPRTSIGRYGNINSDLAYFFGLDDRLAFGLVAGPGVEWEDQPTEDLLALVNGAAGALLHYHWPISWGEQMGVAIGAKYKFGIDNEFDDGWHGGVFVTYAL
jgi:hypothetical protein